ncbi:MAG TPA: hypothetical protein VNK43_04595, partial [Gemmatimonadales bacterium]|nr:hypothetical protein [Gemmatimonadales bacterium]
MRPPQPVVLFVLAYGAGLATGLARFPAPLVAAALLTGFLAAFPPARRHGMPLLLVGALAGGLLSAVLARRADREACPARLPVGRVALTVKVVEPVDSRGGRTELRPEGAGCRGTVRARWPAQAA